MEKEENEQVGKLPHNISKIVEKSMTTIDLTALRVWLNTNKITIEIDGVYKLPSNSELTEMIHDTIKSYYYDFIGSSYYLSNMDFACNDDLYMGGVMIKFKDWYFEIDFQLIIGDRYRNDYNSIYYQNEVQRYVKLN